MDVIVAGLGDSVNLLAPTAGQYVTVGVNDIGRHFTPTHLVVLDGPDRFDADRTAIIRETRPPGAVWARAATRKDQLWDDWDGCQTIRILTETIGKVGKIRLEQINKVGPPSFPCFQISPITAICIAYAIGAQKIGLIGVDLLDHPHFMKPEEIRMVDAAMARLRDSLANVDVELVNLSPTSNLHSLPFVGLHLMEPRLV